MTHPRLLLVCLLVVSVLDTAASAQADPNSEYWVVQTASGDALRFPVMHMHGASRCHGHLTLGADNVEYAVKHGDANHSFSRARSEVREVGKNRTGFLILGVRFKFRGGGDMVFVPVQEKSLGSRNQLAIRAQGRDEGPLFLAGSDFPAAMAKLGGSSPQLAGQSSSPMSPAVAGSQDSVQSAAQRLSTRLTVERPSGIYRLEDQITFNVIDGAYFDAASGQVSLFGHREARHTGPRVPYLQHLAALLQNPRPEFSLTWTKESEQRVQAFLRRAESPQEARRLGKEWGTMSNAAAGDFRLTPQARFLMRGLNVMPTSSGAEQPGYFGADVRDTPDAFGVVITRVDSNGPAAKAGLRPGDKLTQAGPEGNVPITSDEFHRTVKLTGAGAEFNYVVAGRGWEKARLTGASGDVWSTITTSDFVPMLWRAAGKLNAASVIEAFYRHARVIKKYPDMGEHGKRAFFETLYATGLAQEFDRLHREVAAGRLRSDQAEAQIDRQTCAALERKVGLPSGSMTSRFDALLSSRRSVPDAYYEACLAPENYLPVTEDALRIVWQKAGALQIPPEMIDRTFNVRPEVTPEFRRMRPDTLLARAMAEGDYIGKRMMDMPWLERKIPRYMTGYRFLQRNPSFSRDKAAYHMWISVAGLHAVQSPDKSTLELRDARMRFNIREYGPNGRDLPPQPGGYEELLTSIYDDLSLEFPVLHELREAAKLAAIADWVRAKRPDFRLPREGMVRWSAPNTLPGLMYIYAHMPESGAGGTTIATIATGGVALEPWVWSGKADLDPDSLPTDASVVDLRGLSAGALASREGARSAVAIPRYDNQALSRVLNKKIDVPEWRPSGWIAPARKAERVLQTVSVLQQAVGRPGCDGAAFSQKLARLEKLQLTLAAAEKHLNAVNARSPQMTALHEQLESDLRRDKEQFEKQAFDTASDLLFDLRHELKDGTLKQSAEGVAELKNLASDMEGWTSRIQNLRGSEAERLGEMRSIIAGLTEKLSAIEGTAANRYLGPVFKSLDAAARVKDINELYFGFAKVFLISDWRVEQANEQSATDERIRRSILPLQRKLSDQITALQNDPVVSACIASAATP